MEKYLMDELLELRDEVYELKERLKAYEGGQEEAITNLVQKWRLTPHQAKTLIALSRGKAMTREQIESVSGRVKYGDPRNVDSMIKRIRQRNIPGLKIQSLYGVGYCVPQESIGVIKSAMGSH